MLSQSSPRALEEIAEELFADGFEVSQAMLARDLEQVGAVKVRREGRVGYTLQDQRNERSQATQRLERIFAEWAQSVQTSGNLIVVRTPPGSAHLVALAIDQAKFPEVVGTIAGDDAVFVAIRSDLPPEPLATRLREMLGDH